VFSQPFISLCHLNRMNPRKQSAEARRPPISTQAAAEGLTRTGQQLNATNADFLRIDVETALTFTQIALEADDPEKRDRNRKNARKAYDTILHLREKVEFNPPQHKYMNEKLEQLKRDLITLGEKL
jgi:hypothetical protein